MLRFRGVQSYSYMEQRKVETDVDGMTGIELATLQLRRPRTNRVSYVCYNALVKGARSKQAQKWKVSNAHTKPHPYNVLERCC